MMAFAESLEETAQHYAHAPVIYQVTSLCPEFKGVCAEPRLVVLQSFRDIHDLANQEVKRARTLEAFAQQLRVDADKLPKGEARDIAVSHAWHWHSEQLRNLRDQTGSNINRVTTTLMTAMAKLPLIQRHPALKKHKLFDSSNADQRTVTVQGRADIFSLPRKKSKDQVSPTLEIKLKIPDANINAFVPCDTSEGKVLDYSLWDGSVSIKFSWNVEDDEALEKLIIEIIDNTRVLEHKERMCAG
jgi:hypothetical protein